MVLPCSVFASGALLGEIPGDLEKGLAEIEKRSGGRLGCAVLDTSSSRRSAYRGDERFAMCSTFKMVAAALVLHRVDRGEEQLARRIVFTAQEILGYAPVTKEHVGGAGMTVAELCGAAVTWSDNTAANLLLASFGGPAALTAFLRETGDDKTRLDRTEPTLNTAIPGDARDTTTPLAMLETLRRLALGDVLKPASRVTLVDWLMGCQTGLKALRAGVPADWKEGDKTGSGENGTSNDIAVFWPPDGGSGAVSGRAPVLVATYLTETKLTSEGRAGILAEVGRAVAAQLRMT
jgi:beta-lactamase class A